MVKGLDICRKLLLGLGLVLIFACALDESIVREATVLEKRSLNEWEKGLWDELLACFIDFGLVDEYIPPDVVMMHVVAEDVFLCGEIKAGGCTIGCQVYIPQSSINKSPGIYVHEFTHCIEYLITGETSHDSNFWVNGESRCIRVGGLIRAEGD